MEGGEEQLVPRRRAVLDRARAGAELGREARAEGLLLEAVEPDLRRSGLNNLFK